jgi:hypothetical protein
MDRRRSEGRRQFGSEDFKLSRVKASIPADKVADLLDAAKYKPETELTGDFPRSVS